MEKIGVILSGLPGSGKGHLARELSKELGWPFLSIGDLWRKKYSEFNSKKDLTFDEFWKSQSLEDQKTMDSSARQILEKGEIIGDFRFAELASGLNFLFVFLTADLNVRAERAFKMGKYPKKSLEDIKKILEKREQDEYEIGKQIYGDHYDYRSPERYNLLLDSAELSIEEEKQIIKGLLEGKELKQILKNLPK